MICPYCGSTLELHPASLDLVSPPPIVVPPPPPPSPPPTWTGLAPLKVSGNKLVDPAGKAVQLHGVNRSGTEYACSQGWGLFDGPNDQASLNAMKAWNVNAVRVPLNELCWLGVNGVKPLYGGTPYQQAIKDYAALLIASGMYPILDLHTGGSGAVLSSDTQAMPDQDHSPAFWTSVAQAFKGEDRVILELFNEPRPDNNSDTPEAWRCWRDGGVCRNISYPVAGMQSLVTAIRGTGATNVLALGGIRYSNILTSWLAYKPSDPLSNIAAAWHVYNFNGCNSPTCYDGQVAAVAAQVPLIATEIGCDNRTLDATFMTGLMNWLDAHGCSYTAWVWDNWNAPIALITDYAGTPTPYGQVVKSHYATLP